LRGCNHAAILSQPIRSWESPALNSLAAVLLLTHLLPYRALAVLYRMVASWRATADEVGHYCFALAL